MLIIFIIIIIGIITLCDFSSVFLDEELEDILYYRDNDSVAVQNEALKEVYSESDEDEVESDSEESIQEDPEELPYTTPEDDFDSYEDADYSVQSMDPSAIEDLDEIDIETVDTEAILQKIIQESEIM